MSTLKYTLEDKAKFLVAIEELCRRITRAELKNLISLAEQDAAADPNVKDISNEVIALINRVGKFRFEDWDLTDAEILARATKQTLQ